MDTEDQVIESEEQEQPVEESQEVEEEQVEEEVEDQPAEEPEEEPEEEEVEEPKLSPRAEKRIEQLKIKSLIADLKQKSQPQVPSIKPGLDYKETLEADPEVLAQFEQDRIDYGQQNYQAGLEQAKSIQFHTRLEIDAPKIESKYPILSPGSEDFRENAADAINEFYIALTGYDRETGTVEKPNIRYSNYVDAIMELVDTVASQKTQKSTKNIARQAAQTGLRPDGSRAKRLDLSKAPEQMSDEELDAFINSKLK